MLGLFGVRFVSLVSIFVLLSTGNANSEEQNICFLGRATEDGVKIRSGYNKNFSSLYSLKKDELVIVCGKNFSWYKVMLPRESDCYVNVEFVEKNSETTGLIKANKLNIRSGPDIKFDVLGQGEKGEAVIIKGTTGAWYRIFPTGNTYGWVSEDYLENVGDAKSFLAQRKSMDEFEKDFRSLEIECQECMDNISSLKNIYEKINLIESKYSALSRDIAARIQQKKDVVLRQMQALSVAEETVESKPKKENVNIIEAEGRIRELGRFWGKTGTHKLVKGFKTVFYLKSEDLDLNSFLGHKKVKVQGFLDEDKNKNASVLKIIKVVVCD